MRRAASRCMRCVELSANKLHEVAGEGACVNCLQSETFANNRANPLLGPK